MLVSVIIPNYNDKELLRKVLGSRFWVLDDFKTEVILVDNGSTDNSVEYVKKNFPKIRVIALDKNYGFAKAVNKGIKRAKGEYVFLLNNDVVLKKDYLKKLVEFLEKKRDFWFVQGVILTANGKKVDNAGGTILWKGKVKLFSVPQEIRGVDKEPLVLSATATLYRHSLFEKIGLFDEDFFAYLEDVDLCLRAWRRGLKGAVLPDASCLHIGRATSKRMGNFKARMDAKNWIFVIIKNWPIDKLIKYFPQIFVERLRNLSGLIKQTVWWQVPWAILITYGECLFKIPKMLVKRFLLDKPS